MSKGAETNYNWSSEFTYEDYEKTFDATVANVDSIQIGGNHYVVQKIQPWDYIISNGLDWCEGNIVKYVTRWKRKDKLKDLYKARQYMDKLILTAEEEERNERI
jgi:hypothetical protein